MVRIKPEIRFSFPAVLSVVLCTDTEGTAIFCILACILHEIGHIAVMLFKRKPPERIIFYGGGIKLSGSKSNSTAVIIGGCFVNFVLFTVFYFFGQDYVLRLFGMINFLTGVFNLMPVSPLDGYKLLEKILVRLLEPEKVGPALKVTELIACMVCAPLIIVFFINGEMNFSSVVFLFYLLVVDIIEKM